MTSDAEMDRAARQALREQYQQRRMARFRRRQWKWALAMAVLWAVLAGLSWLDGVDPVLRWVHTGAAVLQLVAAAFLWRRGRWWSPS